jgi:hypothetical protein
MVWLRWLTYLIYKDFNLFILKILGVKDKVFGKVHLLTKKKLGMIIKDWKKDLSIVSNLMEIGGWDLKTGRQISIEFIFVKFSQAPGLSFQLQVNGKAIQLEEVILIYMLIRSNMKRTKINKQQYWTLMIVGLIILNLD